MSVSRNSEAVVKVIADTNTGEIIKKFNNRSLSVVVKT